MAQAAAAAAAAAPTTTTTEGEERITVTKALSECEQQTVVVYSTLCEVTRLVEHDFDKPGQYDVCIEGLPNVMLEQTLRVTGGVGHATVLEVTTHRRHDEEADKKALPEDIQQKKAEVERLEAEQRDLKVQLDALQASAAWLEAWANDVADTPLTHAKAEHKADGGAAFLSPEYIGNVQRFTEFYAEEQTRLVTQRKDLQKRIDEAAARLKTANDEYRKAMMANNSGPHVITSATVTLDVSQAGRAAFNIVYRVPGCSWHSRYDCRLGADNKVQLTYYGVVVNSTGEAWLNTHLALSTADPSLCAEPPLLSTALVSYAPPPQVGVPDAVTFKAKRGGPSRRRAKTRGSAEDEVDEMFSVEPEMNVAVTEARRGMTSCTFDIPRRASILSDGEEHKVTVAVIDNIEAKIEYQLLPHLQPTAFTKATCTNTSDFSLLEGPCNVFGESSFLAQSRIEFTAAGQPFSVFLGPDKDLNVSYRAPTAIGDKAGVVFRSNVDKFVGEIRVKNNKDAEVKLVIKEQLPKSSTAEITVTLVKPDRQKTPGVTIEDKNLIQWVKVLSPGQTEVFPVEYTVEYPKGMRIQYNW